MVRHSVALALVTYAVYGALGLSRDPGCGGADSPSSGPNAPCTRSKDCGGDLECKEGVCTEPDAGTAPSDGGPDVTGGDAGGDRG